MYVDSHAHIFLEDYGTDRDDVLKRARDAGVECIVVPGTTVETSREAVELAEKYDLIYACVGIHPHEASKATPAQLVEIEELSKHRKVVGIGEIGLDYHYDFSPPEIQREFFKNQIQLAVRRDLPIVVHTRESLPEAMGLVQEAAARSGSWRSGFSNIHSRFPAPKGVFHCFPGNAEEAWQLMDHGFFVSYPGIVTFKNSSALETVRTFGYDHILIETDSPYLTPVPYRGKRNEPAHIGLIAAAIADACGASVGDVARTTRLNAKRLFNIGPFDPPQIVYRLRNSLYVNMTIRCNADCVFCDRKGEAIVKGHNLKIEHEPSSQELIAAIGDPTAYDEIVFCGYGEPTIRLDVLKEVARWVKEKRGRVRLNTDGHGSVINHHDIVPELVGLVDSVSISLNSIDPAQYGSIMRIDGKRYFEAMLDFVRSCKRSLPEVVMTVVGMNGIDTERAREFVEHELGVTLRVRPYF
jgi:TatD DNase family protein